MNTNTNTNTVEEIYTNGYLGLNSHGSNPNPYVFNGYEYNTYFSDTNQHDITVDHINLDMSFVQMSDNPCIDAETLYLTGMELMENKKHQEALEYLEQAYALGEPKCLGLIISCYLMMQDYQNASMYFDYFIKHDFQDKSLYFSLGNFYFVEAQITDCFDIRTEFFENALTCLARCEDQIDIFPTLELFMGLCYYHLNEYNRAISYLTAFVSYDNTDDTNICTKSASDVITGLKTLICIYEKQNDVKKIIDYFKTLVSIEKMTGIIVSHSFVDIFDNVDILYALGTSGIDNTEIQIKCLTKASEKGCANACFILAQYYTSINDYVNGSKYYKNAYDLGFSMCFGEMISCWFKCGDFTHGEYVEKYCLENNSNDWIVYDYLALGFCDKQANTEKALAYVSKLHEMVGDTHPTVHFVNAICYREKIHDSSTINVLEYYEKFFKYVNKDVYDYLLRLMVSHINDCMETEILDRFMRFVVSDESNYKYYELSNFSAHAKYKILSVLCKEGLLGGVFEKEFQRLRFEIGFGNWIDKRRGTHILVGLGIVGIIMGLKMFVSRTRRFV